ncbi:hypothetical protein HanIR_Chr16g0795611 [Helianthus annuus]|nr:hypothetical protein HanIR_Chr16g0795611 [Helianthus annuus]
MYVKHASAFICYTFCCICLLSIWNTLFYMTFLLCMFTEHASTLFFMNISTRHVYLAYLVHGFHSMLTLVMTFGVLNWDYNTFINIDHTARTYVMVP